MTAQPVLDFHVRLAPRPGAVGRLLAALDGSGVARAVVCAGGTVDLDTLARQLVDGGHVESDADNDAVLAGCAGTNGGTPANGGVAGGGGRLVPFWFGNPHRPPGAYRDRAAEFRGLEVSPAVHGVALTDPRVAALVEVAADSGHPVYTVCLARPGAGVADLVTLARRFPGTDFVLGHSGIGNIDFHALNLIRDEPRILLETSGGYTCVAEAAIDRLGAARVVFGSEYPLQHPAVELAKFAAIGTPPEQWRQIAWENAHRLLGEEKP
ncbi:amidohydrolase family protein [Streptomyces sp. WMMC500]|uniref:amidohydrolase family protein n=1 Tax=Streptomyces sp. WMMC500 TaxID=3015154 RepID=UPI00248B49A3|nr:amidohydrolase family protein [Streptomyces sp. WMMC500]WBB62410.1 amidohydrolase family protein [Streptomyces sp. WMMC500]